MDITERTIRQYAKRLKLPTFANYKEVLEEAGTSATFEEVLSAMMETEVTARTANRNRRMLKRAGFPYLKTLEEFDMKQLNKNVSPMFINELAKCDFIKNKKNIIMIGNPGRGKTHLSIALGIKACNSGYRVIFKNAYALAIELSEATNSYLFGKMEKTLVSADLLILDEMSYFSLNRTQSELMFNVISKRSEIGSTIVTTNLPLSRWTELFDSTGLVTALIDRLTYRSYTLDMNGESYRLMDTRKRMKETDHEFLGDGCDNA